MSVTKNHRIIPENQCLAVASRSSGLHIFCVCNASQEVQHYCDDHREVFSSPCKTAKHHKCKTSTIQQNSSGYQSSTFSLVLSKTKTLSDEYNRLKQQSSGDADELNRVKEACKEEIKTFRVELDTFLNKLVDDMLAELDRCERDEVNRINEHILTLTEALNLLDSDYKVLEEAGKDGRKEVMFISDVQMSGALKKFERRLAELEKGYTKPNLSFERNKTLADLQSHIKTLGFLKANCMIRIQSNQVWSTTASQHNVKVLLDKTAQPHSNVSVKSGDDTKTPSITGTAIMSDGSVVLCDLQNGKLKLFDNSWALTGSLLLSGPFDVSVLNTNNVIVTSPDKKQPIHTSVPRNDGWSDNPARQEMLGSRCV